MLQSSDKDVFQYVSSSFLHTVINRREDETDGGRRVEGNQSPSTPNTLRLNSVEGVEGKTDKKLFVWYLL